MLINLITSLWMASAWYGPGTRGGCGLAATGFHVAAHGVDQCGPNGLPLTPNAIAVQGAGHTLTVRGSLHTDRCEKGGKPRDSAAGRRPRPLKHTHACI